MSIDFERFPLYKGIDRKEKEILNVKRVFAEQLYNAGSGLAFHALALKIYNSGGECEYTDEEYNLMVAFSEQCMSPRFIDSLKALKE